MAGKLTHLGKSGEARMVDVGGKAVTDRRAVAHASVTMSRETAATVARGDAPKGDVVSTARIFTGGVLPQVSDTIVIQENTARDGAIVIVNETTARGKNVRVAGLDFKTGHVGLHRGRRLNGRDVSLAAAMNHATVPVVRRPKVAIAATGDELVPPGTEPKPGQIVYSNLFALAAEGLALAFWKVALRPGKPLLSGHLGAMRVLGLPGNPVSSYVCAVLFLVPLIRKLTGRADFDHTPRQGVLGRALKANDERQDYLRATLERGPDGALVATPFGQQDSSMLVPLAAADCLVIRQPHAPAAAAGTPCAFLALDA